MLINCEFVSNIVVKMSKYCVEKVLVPTKFEIVPPDLQFTRAIYYRQPRFFCHKDCDMHYADFTTARVLCIFSARKRETIKFN